MKKRTIKDTSNIEYVAWNKSLTKETDERVRRSTKAMKGRIPWNKGKHYKIKDTSRMNKDKIGKPSGMLGKHYKCSEEKKKKIGDSNRGKNHPKWNDEIRRKKASERMKGNDYALGKHHTLSEETKNKQRIWHINNPNKKFSDTSIERKIAEELTKRGIVFKQNVGIHNIANVDFYLPDYNIIIECDGCYYHACQQCGFIKDYQDVIIRDKQKTECLQQKGYIVYRFWEHEINKSTKICINKLQI